GVDARGAGIPVTLRMLEAGDAAAFQALRLRGLRESPSAFGSTYEEEADRPLDDVAAHLALRAEGDDVVFGAFDGDVLVGVAGMRRPRNRKGRHRGGVWGMYVAPEARGRGVGGALLRAIVDHARTVEGLDRLELGVETTNAAARALYLAFGFVPYGVQPDAYRDDGVSWDSELMSMRIGDAADPGRGG
ncbi:GNAT family N-acetyltransferase, partial [Longimicrobium sp.]|uniref:GNAT family N-acetyltransferase n=1 Tax=Longimicrobium sp. TaxID=2029185 RepID=UPI002E3094C1